MSSPKISYLYLDSVRFGQQKRGTSAFTIQPPVSSPYSHNQLSASSLLDVICSHAVPRCVCVWVCLACRVHKRLSLLRPKHMSDTRRMKMIVQAAQKRPTATDKGEGNKQTKWCRTSFQFFLSFQARCVCVCLCGGHHRSSSCFILSFLCPWERGNEVLAEPKKGKPILPGVAAPGLRSVANAAIRPARFRRGKASAPHGTLT